SALTCRTVCALLPAPGQMVGPPDTHIDGRRISLCAMTSASPERRARSVKFTIMGYRLFLTLLLSGAGMMFYLQALNGFHDGYAAAGIAVLLLLRLPWLGVVVEDDSLKVRTWLRTH